MDTDRQLAYAIVDRALNEPHGQAATAATAVKDFESLMRSGDPLRFPATSPATAFLFDLSLTPSGPSRQWLEQTFRSLSEDPDDWTARALTAVASSAMSSFQRDPDAYVWLDVTRLPHAHSPAVRRDAHERALRRLQFINRLLPSHWRLDQGALYERAGRAWQRSLTTADFDGRPLDAALPHVRALLQDPAFSLQIVVDHIAQELPDDPALRRMVGSLLLSPITWDSSSRRVSDGQNRIAQARLEGLQQLPVVLL